MSTEILIKAFFVAIYSLTFVCMAYSKCGEGEKEKGGDVSEKGGTRYEPLIDGRLLPTFFVAILVLGLMIYGEEMTVRLLLKVCVDLLLPLSGYYVLLLCLLPSLRRRINARTCALLWALPGYLFIVEMTPMQKSESLLVVSTSETLVRHLLVIWLAGAALFLLWKISSHLVFRKSVLRHAVPICDEAVLTVWWKELEAAGISRENWKGRLLRSGGVTTPFTIGLFRRSLCVVLPEQDYTQEELKLLFRHELVHIGRKDGWSKFFMVFCTALCWFHPLMWVAMKRCAEDLELSCDETVLLEAGVQERRQYANLLLSAAGEGRGFTTCLSATASAMQYRLRCVMKPPKRHTGAILVGLTFFILCMSCGTIVLAYGEEPGKTVLFDGDGPTQYSLRWVDMEEGDVNHEYTDADETALYAYFAGLKLQNMTGTYKNPRSSRTLSCAYDNTESDDLLLLTLTDHQITVTRFFPDLQSSVYYLAEGTDWAAIDTMLESADR